MTAYVLVEMTVTDPVGIEAYRALSGPAVEAHGGRYLARGGPAELLEGSGEPARIVVIEFPDLARARDWYDGELYREARAARASAATARFVLVEGLPA